MKKISILVAAALVLGGFSSRTFADEVNAQTAKAAEETIVSYKDEAGVTPDSLLYKIDIAVDQLRIMLANSEEKEAAVNADIAEERLGESEVMTDEGKVEFAQEALKEYNENITEAASKFQKVAANENIEEASEENTDDNLAQSITDLEGAIQEVQEKSLVVLDTLKDLVPEESVNDVEDVIKQQTAHKEAVTNFVKERHEFNTAKKSFNMAKVALKKVEKGGSEEEVKAAQDKLAEAQNEYLTAQIKLQEAFQDKKTADFGIEENKEKVDSEEAVQASADEAATTEEAAVIEENNTDVTETVKSDENIKANNGNENKSVKIEKEKNVKEKPEQAMNKNNEK